MAGILPFADVPNWRQRELGSPNEFGGNTMAPGRNLATRPDRWPSLPLSTNIEDRRGESPVDFGTLLQAMTGFKPSDFIGAWNTPYNPVDHYGKLLPLITSDPIAKAAGYNDIPVYQSPMNLPWYKR